MTGGADDDTRIEAAIFALLDARAASASICPSDVARALHRDDQRAWRALMPRVREVAARLARDGRLVVTQRGSPCAPDAAAWRGPVRLRRPPP